jgi:hypothetical protein
VSTPAPKKRSAAEAWKALEDRWADDDEADRIAALSPEELEREMATLGVDVEAQREKGRAFAAEVKRAGLAKAADAAERSSDVPAPPGDAGSDGAAPAVPQTTHDAHAPDDKARAIRLRRFGPVWLLAAAIVLVSLGVAAIAGVFDQHEPEPGPRPDQPYEPPTAPPPPPESRAAAATRLVAEARGACAKKEWAVCSARLDEARERDPAVASDPEFAKLRAQLEAKSPGPDGG